MADYRVYWAPILDPLNLTGELPVTSFSYSDTLNSPGSIRGEVPLRPYPTLTADANPWTLATFAEGRTALWVARDDVPVWSGVLWGYDIDLGSDRVAFTGEGWHSALRKMLYAASYVDTEQLTIVQAILTQADSAFTDPGLGPGPAIVAPTSATSALRTISWDSFNPTTCGEAIETLAGLADGFDWLYRTYDDSGTWRIAFDMAPGVDTGIVFEPGGNLLDFKVHSDGKQIAPFVKVFGNGTGSETISSQVFDASLLAQGFPDYFTIESASSVDQTATLDQYAARLLSRSIAPIRMIDVTVAPTGVPALTDYKVGDTATARADRGFLQLDDPYRIVAKTVSVDNTGSETVDLSLSPSVLFG